MILSELDLNPNLLKPNDIKDIDSSKEKLSEINEWIKENCSEFLEIVNPSHRYLYRGFKDIRDNHKSIFMGYPRKDRKSIESHSPNDVTARAVKYADYCMQVTGFTALRSNSIFCNSSIDEAAGWGKLYIIFPINGFTFGYSKKFTRTTARNYLEPHSILIEPVKGMFNRLIKTCNMITDRDSLLDSLKSIIREQFDYLYEWNEYHIKHFNKLVELFNKISKKYPQFVKFKQEMDRLSKINNMSDTDPFMAAEFIKLNELKNTDLRWAITHNQDVWIHGPYIAINFSFKKFLSLRK